MAINAQRRSDLPPATGADPISAMPPQGEDLRLLRHEVSRYIGQMVGELSGMARSADMDLLAYFLDMCRVEANVQMERNES